MTNDTDLNRLLSLSGMNETIGEPYDAASSLSVRMPRQKQNNPRFGDNSLDEANLDKVKIGHTFRNYASYCDHNEAVARTADEFGITGEQVEKIARSANQSRELEFSEDFDDYNDAGEQEIAPKSFKDYLPSDFGSDREVQVAVKKFNVNVEWLDQDYNTHMDVFRVDAEGTADARNKGIAQAEAKAKAAKLRFGLVDADALIEEEAEVDEAYGYSDDPRKQAYIKRTYKETIALLPCPGMFSVDTLGDAEYVGSDLKAGRDSIVCISIETSTKPRLTFCVSSGHVDYNAGDYVLTYHDQTGAERPGTIITTFTGAEWADPQGREAIKSRMAKGGMDPRKKYSYRVFK